MVPLATREVISVITNDLGFDPITVLRLLILIVALLTLLRLIGRVVWLIARLVAGVLIVLVVFALLSGKPTRLGNMSDLRRSAVESAREMFS